MTPQNMTGIATPKDLEDFFESSWFESDKTPHDDIQLADISDLFKSEEDIKFL